MRIKGLEQFRKSFCWYYKPLKLSLPLSLKGIGFLYKQDKEYNSEAVFFYSRNKNTINRFINDLIEKILDINNKSDEKVLLGYVKKGKNTLLIFINKSDVFRLNYKSKVVRVNDIESYFCMCPDEELFTYSLQADIKEI